MCKDRINQVDADTEFDIESLKEQVYKGKDNLLDIEAMKKSQENTVDLVNIAKDKFEIGMLSITNKRAKDEVANTT